MAKRKIALFGGTFDPVHLGHTAVALDAAGQISAERTVFVPAKRSPLKGFLPRASDRDRLAMISLAIAGSEHIEVSDYELNRPAPSYTLDTVRQFQAEHGPDILIYWLLGVDSVDDLQYWHAIEELIDACTLCTMYRGGCQPPDFSRFESIWGPRRVEKLRQNVIRTPLIDISSSEIRKRLAGRGDVSKMLHPAVADYIRSHDLYQEDI